MKKAILFDVYGTLISTGNGSINAVKQILERNNALEIEPTTFYNTWKKLHKERMQSKFFSPEKQIFLEDLKELYDIYDICGDAEADVEIMFSSLYNRVCFPETKEAVTSLKSEYELILASNTDREPLEQNLTYNGLLFKDIYTSEDLQTYKPDPIFYKKIVEIQSLHISDIVFVGDSIMEDVLAPKQLGITTVYVDRKKTNLFQGQDYTVNNLLELKEILKNNRWRKTYALPRINKKIYNNLPRDTWQPSDRRLSARLYGDGML